MLSLKNGPVATFHVTILALCFAATAATSYAADEVEAVSTPLVIKLKPTIDGAIIDNSPFDGAPDGMEEEFGNSVELNSGFHDSRAVLNFDLSSLPQGKRIRRATLEFTAIGKAVGPDETSIPIEIRAFSSNGVLDLSDFHQGRFEGVFEGLTLPLGVRGRADVTPVVRSVFENSQRKQVGIVLRTTGLGGVNFGSLEFPPAITLRIVLVDAT